MNKLVNFSGVLFGFIGILLAVHFHYSTRERKVISYYLEPTSYRIYDNSIGKDLQNLSLYKDDSVRIEQDVFLSAFTIWNSGNMPIETTDIRHKLSINFKGIQEVLEVRIIKENTPNISEFKLNQIGSGSFNLNWRFFDPNDGIKFQILYLGDNLICPDVNGQILKTEIREYKLLKNQASAKYIIYSAPILLVYYVLGLISINRGKKLRLSFLSEIANSYLNKAYNIIAILGFVLYLAFFPFIYYKYFFGGASIPF